MNNIIILVKKNVLAKKCKVWKNNSNIAENFRVEQLNFVRAIQKCWVIKPQQYYNLYKVIFDVSILFFVYKKFFEKNSFILFKSDNIQNLDFVILIKLTQISTMLKCCEYRISVLRKVLICKTPIFKKRPLIIINFWDQVVVFVMYLLLLYGVSQYSLKQTIFKKNRL